MSELTTPLLAPNRPNNAPQEGLAAGNDAAAASVFAPNSHLATAAQKEEIKEVVGNDLVSRVRENVRGRRMYRRMADTAEVLSKLFTGATSILAFSAAAFPGQNRLLSFLAGIFGTVGIALAGWSQYSSNESNERLSRLQTILKSLGLGDLPADASAATFSHEDNNTLGSNPQIA